VFNGSTADGQAGREALLGPSPTGTFASRVVGSVQGVIEAPGGAASHGRHRHFSRPYKPMAARLLRKPLRNDREKSQ
jgi:hypothetical protein